MRVLVTGAGGFVGGHLVPRLTAEGFDVVATDRELDVADSAAIAAAIRRIRPGAIVHLAAQSSVVTSWREPESTYRVNYLGTRSVLSAAAGSGERIRVLLVSSAALYGSNPPGAAPFTESAALRPHSPYARTKAAADLLGAHFAARGVDVVRVRAFNHAGPGQTPDFVLPSFAMQIAEIEAGLREARLRVGNLDSLRDFLDVGDVVDAYLRLLDPAVPADVYNVASGVGVRVGDLLESLVGLSKARLEVAVEAERVRDTDCSIGDASRLRDATGWEPRTPIESTLASVLDDWRTRVAAR